MDEQALPEVWMAQANDTGNDPKRFYLTGISAAGAELSSHKVNPLCNFN
jgi:hypothetical protein